MISNLMVEIFFSYKYICIIFIYIFIYICLLLYSLINIKIITEKLWNFDYQSRVKFAKPGVSLRWNADPDLGQIWAGWKTWLPDQAQVWFGILCHSLNLNQSNFHWLNQWFAFSLIHQWKLYFSLLSQLIFTI